MRTHRLLLLLALLGCSAATVGYHGAASPSGAISVDSLLGTLTVRQKAAQLVMPFLPGAYAALDDSDFQVAVRWIDTLEVGGVIVSVGSPFDIAAKLNALQRRSRLPLLVSADLEWGAGMRLVGATAFPHIMAVGATRDPRDAHTIGAAAAVEGRAVGIHVNFAPDADVVMSAHIAFPALTGSDDPGTLSAAVLTGLLRDSLHFQGLVVTDALMMGAIVAKYGAGEATVRAFLAGSDLLLMPADPDSAVNAMVAAVEAGRITRERLDASVRRALEVKRGLGLFARRTVPLDSLMAVVGTRRLRDEARDIAVRALTLVRDSGGALRALRGQRSHLALIAYADEMNGSVGTRLADQLRQGGDTVDFFRLWPMSGTLSYDSARATLGRSRRAVFVANVRPLSWRGTIALPDSLAALITATDRKSTRLNS